MTSCIVNILLCILLILFIIKLCVYIGLVRAQNDILLCSYTLLLHVNDALLNISEDGDCEINRTENEEVEDNEKQ